MHTLVFYIFLFHRIYVDICHAHMFLDTESICYARTGEPTCSGRIIGRYKTSCHNDKKKFHPTQTNTKYTQHEEKRNQMQFQESHDTQKLDKSGIFHFNVIFLCTGTDCGNTSQLCYCCLMLLVSLCFS